MVSVAESRWTRPIRIAVIWRVLLGVAGFEVALFWLLQGFGPMLQIWGPSLIDPGQIQWGFALGGLALLAWTYRGIVKPSWITFFPPAVVSFPLALLGLYDLWFGG
jgi:hypothetical protein